MSIGSLIRQIHSELPSNVKLVAVSKYHPVTELMEAYNAGQRSFGENIAQEFSAKVPQMPSDVEWHFIGHLQTNKLKLVLPHASMIQSVDSIHLLNGINGWCASNGKITDVLLELHLGAEETKHGLTEEEVISILDNATDYANVRFCGLMGMATNTDDVEVVRKDFLKISEFKSSIRVRYPELQEFNELSIGMSEDYPVAVECGATIVRIGTKIFGPREY